MNNILIIGAGMCSGALIQYVLQEADIHGWFVTVADIDLNKAQRHVSNNTRARAAWLDVLKSNDRRDLIHRSDLVVTMLPAHLHLEVAHDCIRLNKLLVTAASVTQELYRLGDEGRERSLSFTGEMSLDPGLEHMAAKRNIDDIEARGGTLQSFHAYVGGLLARESFDNPWKYKLTWNPRNLTLAGQGTAQYLKQGKYHFIPYNRLFSEYRVIKIKDVGTFEVFANRDSLLNRPVYGLDQASDVFRGTLRYPGFCDTWGALVQLGMTDAAYPIQESENLTYYEIIEGLVVGRSKGLTLKERVANLLEISVDSKVILNLEWLGLFSRRKVEIMNATPALILENLLKSKMLLQDNDLDLVVMHHEIIYHLGNNKRKLTATLQLQREPGGHSAMSRIIGLPIGIFVKHIMKGSIKATGTNIPMMPEVYLPVLEELRSMGVEFQQKDEIL